MSNPCGPHGCLTKFGERIPVLNHGIQALHKSAGQQDAWRRAHNVNPIGAGGYITKIGERIPFVNTCIQELHRSAGKDNALERAREVNPLDKLINKQGILVKIAELVPGLNVVAAAINELNGDHEKADESLDLVRNWQRVGKPNGPLAKLAELLPGLDFVAFALHMNGGNYPHALRSITKTSWIRVEVDSILLAVQTSSVKGLRVCAFKLIGARTYPEGLSLLEALLDLSLDLFHINRSDALNGKFGANADGGYAESFIDRLNQTWIDLVEETMKGIPQYVRQMDDFKNAYLSQRHVPSFLLRAILSTKVPALSKHFLHTIENAIGNVKMVHGPIARHPKVRRRVQNTVGCLGSRRVSRCAACVTCLAFTGCFAGLGVKSGFVGCLVGVTATLSRLRRVAIVRSVSWLNTQNRTAWFAWMASTKEDANVDSRQGCKEPRGDELFGVTSRFVCDDIAKISPFFRKEIFDRLTSRWRSTHLVWAIEICLRRWCGRNIGASVPFVVHIETPETFLDHAYTGSREGLTLPKLDFLVSVELDMSGGDGPYIRKLSWSISDEAIQKLVDVVSAQVATMDIRHMDGRLRDFEEPVNIKFKVDLQWARCDYSHINLTRIQSFFKLPK